MKGRKVRECVIEREREREGESETNVRVDGLPGGGRKGQGKVC